MTKRDIKLFFENGSFDIGIEDGDFIAEDGFDTAIWVSLFTDARADESQVVLPENRRGWMGNLANDERQLGGLLWLVEQRRLNQDTLNETIDYARKSLIWFIEDGLATQLNVTGEIVPRSGISLTMIITSVKGVTSTHYVNLWELTGN